MRTTAIHEMRRRGTTIAELMVALVLFGVGTACLAGGMRSAARASAHGRSFTAGAHAAESRLERLRSRCGMSAGAAASGAVAERWHLGPPAGPLLGSVEAEDSLTLTLSTRTAGRVVRSIVRCMP